MFFVTFLAVYVLINAYVFFRGFAALSDNGWWVVCLKCLFAALVVAFPVTHALADGRHGALWDIAELIGSFWLVAMVYLFLIVLLSDIVKLIDRVFPVIPARLKADPRRTGRAAFFGAVGLVVLVVFFGWLNTRFIRERNITIGLENLPKAHNPTTVVFASDLHIGPGVHERRVKTFVREINAADPDIILIGGDLVEGSIAGLGPMTGILSGLHAPRGVYAVMGNHEYHGGPDRAEEFMESAGITVLRDEVVTVGGIVNIVGLDDPRAGSDKVPVTDLIARCDPSLPVILLTHRPVNMEEYAADGIDLMLAGHSHHGQFFPLTIITDLVYTVSYGYARIGPMRLYVTSGLGTWGPPVRVLTHPEVVKITLESWPGRQ